MGIAAILTPLVPGLVQGLLSILQAIRADSATTDEQKATVKAQIDRLSAELDHQVQAVLGAPDVQ